MDDKVSARMVLEDTMKDIKETQRHIQKIEEENGEEKMALLHCLAGLHQRFQLVKALLEKAGD